VADRNSAQVKSEKDRLVKIFQDTVGQVIGDDDVSPSTSPHSANGKEVVQFSAA